MAEETGNYWLCPLFPADKKHIAQGDDTSKTDPFLMLALKYKRV